MALRSKTMTKGPDPEEPAQEVKVVLYRTAQEALSNITRHAVASIGKPYSEAVVAELSAIFEELAAGPRCEVLAEGVAAERIDIRRSLDLRYRGVDAVQTIQL